MENTQSNEILKTAILMEKRGKAFYEMVAQQTKSDDVKKIFSMMAEEEQTHVEFLSKQFASYNKNQKFDKIELKADAGIVDEILSGDIKKQISAASFEAAAISAAIDMETKAIEVYSKQAAEATDPNEKELFSWLADWEKGHHKVLHELNEQLKEDIWYDNQFWPF
ncbi:MAG: rubrerythrin [Bacteroidetes bacterium HGW-Bacteroidetes-11]|jgi:rubrerythrin|nr:MAG: rubrerythrin [Bacteroidetes bacterium HGW-Bacteroidetes-11]